MTEHEQRRLVRHRLAMMRHGEEVTRSQAINTQAGATAESARRR